MSKKIIMTGTLGVMTEASLAVFEKILKEKIEINCNNKLN